MTVTPVPAAPNESACSEVIPDRTAVGTFEVGNRLVFNERRRITALAFYRDPAATMTGRALNLWRTADQALLASVTSSDESGSGWKQYPLAMPVEVDIGDDVVVSYFTTEGFAYYSGAPVSEVASMTAVEGRYHDGASQYPEQFGPTNYMADLVCHDPTIRTQPWLSQLATDLLASAKACYAAPEAPTIPDIQLVTHGMLPAVDCPFLAVTMTAITADVLASKPRCAVVPSVTFRIWVVRCFPTLDNQGNPPKPADEQADSADAEAGGDEDIVRGARQDPALD